MGYINFDYSNSLSFINDYELNHIQSTIPFFHNKIKDQIELTGNSLGWLEYPIVYDVEEFNQIKKAAEKVRNDSTILLVIGIGGSYMGTRAGIEMLTHSFYNNLSTKQREAPQIFYVGNNLSSIYMADLMDLLENQDFSINVISKSGTTIEPAIAFRVFRKILQDKYGESEARKRIYVTTDKERGLLKKKATLQGYETFVIPHDIGGRFSVLTSVGLFPMAVCGICIDTILEGAAIARMELKESGFNENMAYQYAIIRNLLYGKGKCIELLVSYEPSFQYFTEWWKQLYAESEGKDGKGIFPSTAIFSTDLHSLGQYIQEGRRNLFETIITVEKTTQDVMLGKEVFDHDKLNYLNGRTVNFVNKKAFEGTLDAHVDGGIPNLVISIPEITPFTFGYLVYFFQLACTMSGYLLGVNPFNQPGVEQYKRNMFSGLGKLS